MAGHLALVAALLAVAYIFARVAGRAGLPPAAATTLVGVAAGSVTGNSDGVALTPATLAIFLPALIFDGAWAIDGDSLRRQAWTVAILAIPGTLVTAAIVACGGAFGGLPLAAALALGAMLAATDPVAVLALFAELPVPDDLRTIVEGESIANDCVAAVLTTAVAAFAIASPQSASPVVGAAVALGVYAAVAGLAIGAGVAMLASRMLRDAQRTAFAVVLTVAIAYGSYALATLAHASGIFASAAAGVVLTNAAYGKPERRRVASAWDGIANAANAIVFLLVGLNLRLERILHEPLLVASAIGATVAARLVLAYAAAPLCDRHMPATWRHTIALAGLRGGLSLALALGLPPAFPARAMVLDAVFSDVFTTLVLQSWALGPILRRFNFR